MMLKDNYFINQHMMYMFGFLDRYGKPSTLVKEVGRMFVVDQSPREILEYSLRIVGFNLTGAMKTARRTHGDRYLCPIMVNPIMKIVVFPNQSANRDDTIWFNPAHIYRTNHNKCKNRKTFVLFKNGHSITVDSRLSSFNTKLQTAEQYCKATTEAGKDPFSFVLDPKMEKILLSFLIVVKCLTETMEEFLNIINQYKSRSPISYINEENILIFPDCNK